MPIDVDLNLAEPRSILQGYIDAEQLTIPVLPAVAIDMLRMYKDPDTNARAMADLIQKDQSLVGSVVRVCNSAAYGGVRQITSLQLAIARLGIRVLGRIAVSHIVRGKVFSAHAHEQEMADIWSHAQLTALIANEVARQCGLDEEEAYLCGLLHSIGKPSVFQAIEELKGKGMIDVTPAEESALAEEFHCVVGFKVAEAWSLPPVVRQSCLHYKDPTESPVDTARVVSIVHVAHRLALSFRDADTEDAKSLLNESVIVTAGISDAALKALIDEAESFVQKAEGMGR